MTPGQATPLPRGRQQRPAHLLPAPRNQRGDISPVLRAAIEERALELFATRDAREASHVIAGEFGCPEALVDRVLIGLLGEYRQTSAVLRCGVSEALHHAGAVRRGFWGDRA